MDDSAETEALVRAATDVFEKDVGVWDVEMEIRPVPGAAAIRQLAVATCRRIAGGKWLVTDYRAESGFEGHGIYGFDPATGKYTGAWVDTGQQAIARSLGSWDAARRTMTFEVETLHRGQPVRYREVTETRPDGSQLYRNLVPLAEGGEHEMIRAVYRRRP